MKTTVKILSDNGNDIFGKLGTLYECEVVNNTIIDVYIEGDVFDDSEVWDVEFESEDIPEIGDKLSSFKEYEPLCPEPWK